MLTAIDIDEIFYQLSATSNVTILGYKFNQTIYKKSPLWDRLNTRRFRFGLVYDESIKY